MVESWLLNSTRFCFAPNGDFDGNDPDRCWWGLPSVSADDPTYMVPGHWNYWRGLSWGPMSQIVYWSLQQKEATPSNSSSSSSLHKHRYYSKSDSPLSSSSSSSSSSTSTKKKKKTKKNTKNTVVDAARKALCRQMGVLLSSQWTRNRHVCENYS